MSKPRPKGMTVSSEFHPAERNNQSLLARSEKRTLIWLAGHMPPWLTSDHLTALGFVSLIGVGASYWYARYRRIGLLLAILFFVFNWFGDSLDGTLARVRNRQRPRYGFYIDHVLDALGSVSVFAGLALSGFMSERVAVGLLVAYFLLSIEVYLATYTAGEFKLSFAAFSPTELRLLLIAGNIAVFLNPAYPLFDIGGVIGIAGISFAFLWSLVKHAAFLYQVERLP
jgi:phosphatidylglycerophosphate synthase